MPKKAKTKKWFSIISPNYLGERELGKVLASDENSLIGRKIEVSAVELTNDFNKYYLKLKFRIFKIENDRALTEFDGSECSQDYISRMVLHHVTRVDNVQDLTTKDGIKIRVKSLTVVARRVSTKIKKTVRKKVGEIIEDFVKNHTLEDFVKTLLTDEFKNRTLQILKKIHPVRYFEFRKTEIL